MQGVYMVVYPALVQPFMRKVTGGDQVALGHTGNTGIALSGLVATLTRGKGTSKSTEDLNFPKGLGFLRDTTVVIALGTTIIIPGVVAHFMTGAAAGVIGNGAGGRRGAILGAFSNGLLITFLPLFLLPVLGDMGLSNATFSDSDYGVVGLFLGGLSSAGGQLALIVGIILAVVLLYVLTFLKRKQKVVETAEAATATK